MVPEIVAKVSKELIKMNIKYLNDDLLMAFESLLSNTNIQLINPKVEHITLSIKLRTMGHKDIFDCIAYSTAYIENASFLTMDSKFVNFLKQHNFDTSFILNHNDLSAKD